VELERTMTREVVTCCPEDSLAQAARRMRAHDCGSLPVVDAHGRVVGMLTDRDICMAALDHGRALRDLAVRLAMTHDVVSLEPSHSLALAAELMGECQIRRLPVVDGEHRPIGLVSLVDLARRAESGEMRDEGDVGMDDVSAALAGIGRPRPTARPLREPPAARGLTYARRPLPAGRGHLLAPKGPMRSRR